MTHAVRLPKGWAEATLPELVAAEGILTDGDWVESKDQDPDGDVRLTQLADVGDGLFRDRSSRFMTSEKAAKLGCTCLRKDDIMIARMPDPLGRSCLFPSIPTPSVTVVDVCVVRPETSNISNRWLMHTLNSPDFRLSVSQLQSGSTRKRISKKNLCTIEFPVPPTNEQHRIVEAIESYLTRLDAAVVSLERVQKNLKRYRASVLKAAVEGRLVPTEAELARKEGRSYEPASELLNRILDERRKKWIENAAEKARAKAEEKARKAGKPWTHADDIKTLEKERVKAAKKYKEPAAPNTSNLPDLPEDWFWAGIEQLCGYERNALKAGPFGSSLRKSFYVSSGFKIYGQEQVLRADPHYGEYYIDEERFRSLESCSVKRRDLLISLVGTIGRTLILPDKIEPGIINPRIIKVTLNEQVVLPEFVQLYLASPRVRELFTLSSHGGTMEILNMGILKELPFPTPPLSEQARIVNTVRTLGDAVTRTSYTLQRSLAWSGALRQSILKWAFEGKLVEQDPNDEPASVLLERIKAGRKSMQPRKRRRTGKRKNVNTVKHDGQLDLLGGSNK